MALSTSRFVPTFLDLVGAAKCINQIKGHPINPGISLFEESSGSQTDRAFVAIKGAAPTVSIQTTDLTILGTIGFAGYSWNGGSAIPVNLYARELPLGGVPSALASAAHFKCSISDGLLIPMGISCGHQGVAELSLMLYALLGTGGSSGARPMVFSVSQAIPTGDTPEPGANNIYTIGGVHFASSDTSPVVSPRLPLGITQLRMNFGISAHVEGTDSDVYPSFAAIMSRAPTVEFTTTDLHLAYEVGDGIGVTAFDTYFQGVATNGQRIPKASSLHTKISATAGMITPGSISLQHKSKAETSFTFTPASASPIVSISTTATIPTTP